MYIIICACTDHAIRSYWYVCVAMYMHNRMIFTYILSCNALCCPPSLCTKPETYLYKITISYQAFKSLIRLIAKNGEIYVTKKCSYILLHTVT